MNAPLGDVERIFLAASVRAAQHEISYAGEVTPTEAHQLMRAGFAKMIDVRSRVEHELVGRVPGSILIPWKAWPTGELNPRFIEDLRAQCAQDDILLFLCRSAVRSHAAATAAVAAGFRRAYNILEGFEGEPNHLHQRGHAGGWRRAGLPWEQD